MLLCSAMPTLTWQDAAPVVAHLKDPKTAARLRIQTVALSAIHETLAKEGALQLMPVLLSPVTDPLNHEVSDAAITHEGQVLQLTKSMILHKQAAMLTGADAIYVVSPNVRLEPTTASASGRHLFEFTQVDIELRGADKDQFIALMESIVVHVIERVKQACTDDLALLGRELKIPTAPFPRYESKDLQKQHGAQWEAVASMEADHPFWVFDHEREFYDREDPERRGYYHNYDLVWPEGFGEALSGAEREWELPELLRKIKERDQDPADFAPYLALAEAGELVPSAGGGLGVERLVRYLTGTPHIGDAVLFPRVPGKKVAI